jgi:hypothetical protein
MESLTDQIDAIKRSSTLPDPPPIPSLPDLHHSLSVVQKILVIQRFISSFQYNYSGQPFVKMQKSRGMIHISSCAQEIVRLGLPIQCIEAVFLGCFLTATIQCLDRIPLSFKSKCGENTHRHIVLAVRYNNMWGAIGISRRNNLMGKDLFYETLSALVLEYKKSYQSCYHHMVAVYVGLPFSHDVFSDMPIKWRAIRVNTTKKNEARMVEQLDSYVLTMHRTFEFFKREGHMPDNTKRKGKVPSCDNGGKSISKVGKNTHNRSSSKGRSKSFDSDNDD